jgi:nitroimidazol reductase NimA-like FMN-containing flavoprotein (pyridoxamine 5'-phosphate oxidase superfamily)
MNTERLAALDARFSNPGVAATPWAEVRSVLEANELFWISTVRADGRPHVTPIPAVWHDGSLHFCTGEGEQKQVNLRHDPRCALTTGTNRWKSGLDVVVEGSAVRVADDERLRALARAWETKYDGDWAWGVADGMFVDDHGQALVYEVVASKVLAFAKGEFAQTRFVEVAGPKAGR